MANGGNSDHHLSNRWVGETVAASLVPVAANPWFFKNLGISLGVSKVLPYLPAKAARFDSQFEELKAKEKAFGFTR